MRKFVAVCLLTVVMAALAVAQEKSASPQGTVAMIFYWKAKPGKLDEYSRYIREYALPIDMNARRAGAFLSVTTYVSQKPDSPWTHMRVFILKDQAQADALKDALDKAGERLHPDAAERKKNGDYGATLRDSAGSEEVQILH